MNADPTQDTVDVINAVLENMAQRKVTAFIAREKWNTAILRGVRLVRNAALDPSPMNAEVIMVTVDVINAVLENLAQRKATAYYAREPWNTAILRVVPLVRNAALVRFQ